ncbi:MAG TPA: N-acetylmuramoyl-L-alanine amidase [Anaerovoracaceae bacterium]|nr:N-acetylmuramoyl-L-alanine amidase [Anaerovoracaceae bacterium]
MPTIYLSPSTQENEYTTGGNEEYYMNLIVDAMIPYLKINGLDFARNNPGDSIDQIIDHTKERIYDLYIALHSTSSPEGTEPPPQGLNVYHYAYTPVGGERAAFYIAENLKEIYPYPNLVTIIPADTRELRDTNATATLVELGYRGNPEDEMWMKQNIDMIAKNLVRSITQFLNLPFTDIVAAFADC